MKNEISIEPQTAIHRMVAAAREGREPRVIARLYSGWALFGERQFLRGYTLLLPDPVVPTLNALDSKERVTYLQDVARLGDAVLKLTGAARINYAILGNQEPALQLGCGAALRPGELSGPRGRIAAGTHAHGGHETHALSAGGECQPGTTARAGLICATENSGPSLPGPPAPAA
jgi:hypothetical protein